MNDCNKPLYCLNMGNHIERIYYIYIVVYVEVEHMRYIYECILYAFEAIWEELKKIFKYRFSLCLYLCRLVSFLNFE